MAMPKATPKARLFQMYPFGKGLNFSTESVPTLPSESIVAGSTSFFTPNHAVTFRCTLSLPDGSQVISDLFHRKKDAEHDASQKALNQMHVPVVPNLDVLTTEERWENLRRRLVETFSDKNVLSYMPLREHFKMSVKRRGARYGQVPIAAIAALDAKVNTLCKVIDRKSETDPVYAIALICKAASKCPSLKLDIENVCISRIEPFKLEVEQELLVGKREVISDGSELICNQAKDRILRFTAVYVPFSASKAVCSCELVVRQDDYFMDVLAERIGLDDGSKLVISRSIGKTHPALRLYWPVPEHLPKVQDLHNDSTELPCGNPHISAVDHEDLRRYSVKQGEGLSSDLKKNVRATLLIGYPVSGDVILSAVGCDWRSLNAYSLDVTLNFYYRLLLGKFPQGNYKLNRGAVLASDLPLTFSSRLQWRGMSPRGLLIEFCQQHRLPEPVFVLSSPGNDSKGATDLEGKIPGLAEFTDLDETNPLKLGDIDREAMSESGSTKNDDDNHSTASQGGPFSSVVKIELLKGSLTEFSSDGPYRNRHDAIQSCALKALHSCRPWFERCLRGSYEPIILDNIAPDMKDDLLKLKPDGAIRSGTGCTPGRSVDDFFQTNTLLDTTQAGQIPSPGSMVTIRYNVRWLRDGEDINQPDGVLESKEEFTFELGSGAVIAELDSLVAEMQVGQMAWFYTRAPPTMMFFAAAGDLPGENGCPGPGAGQMKYSVLLLKYAEPPEERMEAALFKPSLSKQRLGCALSIIQKLKAKSLIDLGCGSGSLMENLLEERTGLVELTGVDISSKSLLRAAKVLSAKLVEDQPGKKNLETIKLYEGSIAEFHSHMQGIDVAVCIEVVEHMDPEPLSKFGSTVLGKLQPHVLIVSTPNFEYNPILQGLSWDPLTNSLKSNKDSIEKNNGQNCQGSNLDSTLGEIMEQRIEIKVPTGGNLDLPFGSATVKRVEERIVNNSDSALGASLEKRIRLSGVKNAVISDSSRAKLPQYVVKFRNDDHRFEWTRAEFRHWAFGLANEYKYDVTFDGVGGSGEDEGPGYASQIAIFTLRPSTTMQLNNSGSTPYEVGGNHHLVWQWMSIGE